MMHGMEKSDLGVVAEKSANKGTSVPAESMEPRTEPKGNPGGQSTRRAQDRERVTQAADRIRQFVQREPRERLTALLHHVTVDALRWAFFELKKDAAAGADGVTWREYEEGLEGRLADLHDRVHSGAYRATPSRRVNIPKPDGGTRPLGVAEGGQRAGAFFGGELRRRRRREPGGSERRRRQGSDRAREAGVVVHLAATAVRRGMTPGECRGGVNRRGVDAGRLSSACSGPPSPASFANSSP